MSWWEQVGTFLREDVAPKMVADLEATAAEKDYVLQFGSGQYNDPTDPDVYLGAVQPLGTSADATEQAVGRDSIVPLSRANGLIYTWSEDRLREFQQQIIDAGIVDADDISLGARDALTIRAWQQLAGQAADAFMAGARMSPTDLLGDLVRSPIPRQSQQRAPFSPQVSNPLDIKAGLKAAFVDYVGSGAIPDDELEKMVSAFQSVQVTAQKGAYDAAESGGTSVAAPDFGAFAEQQAREFDPVGFDAHRFLDKFSVVQQALAGGSD